MTFLSALTRAMDASSTSPSAATSMTPRAAPKYPPPERPDEHHCVQAEHLRRGDELARVPDQPPQPVLETRAPRPPPSTRNGTSRSNAFCGVASSSARGWPRRGRRHQPEQRPLAGVVPREVGEVGQLPCTEAAYPRNTDTEFVTLAAPTRARSRSAPET